MKKIDLELNKLKLFSDLDAILEDNYNLATYMLVTSDVLDHYFPNIEDEKMQGIYELYRATLYHLAILRADLEWYINKNVKIEDKQAK